MAWKEEKELLWTTGSGGYTLFRASTKTGLVHFSGSLQALTLSDAKKFRSCLTKAIKFLEAEGKEGKLK